MNVNIGLLSKILYLVGENDKEYIFKCPLHEDHNHKPNKGHFYVSKENGKFICFKCGVKGTNILKFLVSNYKNLSNIKQEGLQDFLTSTLSLFKKEQQIKIQNQLKQIDLDLDKISLYKELINYLSEKTQKRYQSRLIEYFESKRKIYNKKFIKNMIYDKKILYFNSKDKFSTNLIEQIYGKKIYRDGIVINFNSFDPLNYNSQIRILNHTNIKYFNLILHNRPGLININTINYSFPHILFIVEGVFDNIKLDYFLNQQTNYIILSMLGKNHYKSFDTLKKFITTNNINISHMFILLDNDVTKNEMIKLYKEINKRIQIPEKNTYIREFNNNKYKDLDEMEQMEIQFVEYTLYVTDLIKLKKLKGG